jgi:hypothetical protein
MSEQRAIEIWNSRMIGAIKNFVVTTIAILVWLLATVVAITLVSVFTGMWYVFFGTPVFGDFLGVSAGRTGVLPDLPKMEWLASFNPAEAPQLAGSRIRSICFGNKSFVRAQQEIA